MSSTNLDRSRHPPVHIVRICRECKKPFDAETGSTEQICRECECFICGDECLGHKESKREGVEA